LFPISIEAIFKFAYTYGIQEAHYHSLPLPMSSALTIVELDINRQPGHAYPQYTAADWMLGLVT